MTTPSVVYLLDVDNTLLDSDRVIADLMRHLDRTVGHALQQEYWTIFNRLRAELGYADYLGALQAYRADHPRDLNVLQVSSFLINYPFANRLFPNSLDVIDRLKSWGRVAIVTDGDVVFQPRKIERAGLFEAVDGQVLIYVHKELEIEDVERRFPASHYVIVDDKLRLLTAFKAAWGAASPPSSRARATMHTTPQSCSNTRRPISPSPGSEISSGWISAPKHFNRRMSNPAEPNRTRRAFLRV